MRRVRSSTGAAVASLALVAGGPAGAEPATAYPAPGPLPPVTAATVDARYAATQQVVAEALAAAEAAGRSRRAAALRVLAGRQLLHVDPRGGGRVVEVIGDLAGAERIAVMVPGSHTALDTFDHRRGPGGTARALAAEVGAVDPAVPVAVVAWLGYDTPQGIGAATDRLARDGARALRATVARVRAVNGVAPISVLCHSYGSVVCGHAAPDLPAADLVLYGSPGVGAGTAGELGTDARVWAGRSEKDWIRHVPSVRLAGIGFGSDPVDPTFGARIFDAGDGGHGDYHLPGSRSLRSLARITLGEPVVHRG